MYYPYDFDTYYNGRSFYFDYEEYLFGPVAKTPQELISAIQAPAEDESEIRRKFGEKYMSACDGRATWNGLSNGYLRRTGVKNADNAENCHCHL